jgi:hypothetical protein
MMLSLIWVELLGIAELRRSHKRMDWEQGPHLRLLESFKFRSTFRTISPVEISPTVFGLIFVTVLVSGLEQTLRGRI